MAGLFSLERHSSGLANNPGPAGATRGGQSELLVRHAVVLQELPQGVLGPGQKPAPAGAIRGATSGAMTCRTGGTGGYRRAPDAERPSLPQRRKQRNGARFLGFLVLGFSGSTPAPGIPFVDVQGFASARPSRTFTHPAIESPRRRAPEDRTASRGNCSPSMAEVVTASSTRDRQLPTGTPRTRLP